MILCGEHQESYPDAVAPSSIQFLFNLSSGPNLIHSHLPYYSSKKMINISFPFWLRVIITKSGGKNLWLWSECLQFCVCTYIFRYIKKSLGWVIYIHDPCYYYSCFSSCVLNPANETNQLLKLKLWESSLTPLLPHPLYFINLEVF